MEVRPPLPSVPIPLLPQQYAAPDASTPQVKREKSLPKLRLMLPPAAICVKTTSGPPLGCRRVNSPTTFTGTGEHPALESEVPPHPLRANPVPSPPSRSLPQHHAAPPLSPHAPWSPTEITSQGPFSTRTGRYVTPCGRMASPAPVAPKAVWPQQYPCASSVTPQTFCPCAAMERNASPAVGDASVSGASTSRVKTNWSTEGGTLHSHRFGADVSPGCSVSA